MRVLLTHERFAPDFGGGGEVYVLETARNLVQRGVDVTVLTTGDPSLSDYDGIRTVRLPIHRYRFNFALGPILRHARSADVIQTFNYHACFPSLLAGKRLDKPVVCTFLGLFQQSWKEMRGPWLGRLFMAWERFLVTRRFSRTLFLSEHSQQQAVELGVPTERSAVAPPGIDLAYYRAATEKDDVVLFVGKFDVRKGYEDVLEAARALPGVRFLMIGWGQDPEVLRRRAPANLEIRELERGAPLRAAFAGARIFVLPTRSEGFPIALMEAMASGCAVICTLPLQFEGVRTRPGDRVALVEAIRNLRAQPETCARMGHRNAEMATAFTWDRNIERLLRVYDTLLGNGAAGVRSDTNSAGFRQERGGSP